MFSVQHPRHVCGVFRQDCLGFAQWSWRTDPTDAEWTTFKSKYCADKLNIWLFAMSYTLSRQHIYKADIISAMSITPFSQYRQPCRWVMSMFACCHLLLRPKKVHGKPRSNSFGVGDKGKQCFVKLFFFFGLVIVSITPSPGRLLKLDAWASEWQPFKMLGKHLPAFSRLQSTLWINLAFQTLYITTVPGLQYHCKKYNTSIQTVLLLHLSLMGIIVHDPLSSNIHFIAPVKHYSICDNCVT